MKRTIAIALSGGIDSLVSAYLLKEQGHIVRGLHFITGYESALQTSTADSPEEKANRFSNYKKKTRKRFAFISRQVDIPIDIIDLRQAFSKYVVDYFINAYDKGKTPNPCLVCNPSIKFGEVLRFVRSNGTDILATGHYARVVTARNDRPQLFKGIDAQKDQSYFLSRLTREQLSHACFPLGEMTKRQTIALAKDKGLSALSGNESQDICFITDMTYSDFLTRHGVSPRAGSIIDVNGNVLGEHQGLHRFTVGQRKGINCPGPAPYYVVKIDMADNLLVVGFQKDLYTDRCQVYLINWIADPPTTPIKVATRLRYRHKAVNSTLIPAAPDTATVVFNSPQPAVAPGQGAVFYHDNEVLGGGWID